MKQVRGLPFAARCRTQFWCTQTSIKRTYCCHAVCMAEEAGFYQRRDDSFWLTLTRLVCALKPECGARFSRCRMVRSGAHWTLPLAFLQEEMPKKCRNAPLSLNLTPKERECSVSDCQMTWTQSAWYFGYNNLFSIVLLCNCIIDFVGMPSLVAPSIRRLRRERQISDTWLPAKLDLHMTCRPTAGIEGSEIVWKKGNASRETNCNRLKTEVIARCRWRHRMQPEQLLSLFLTPSQYLKPSSSSSRDT